MRRALVNLWPALSYHFGLHPRDVEELTYGEIESYVNALRQINDANRSMGR